MLSGHGAYSTMTVEVLPLSRELNRVATVPNALALLRLFLVPVMWVLALLQLGTAVGFGLIIAAATDFLDGLIARRFHQVTRIGSRLDTIADNALLISVVLWVPLIAPEIWTRNVLLDSIALVLYFLFLLTGWLRFRRFANLHLYSAKVGAGAGYLCITYTLLFGYNQALFYLAIVLLIVASAEGLLVFLTRDSVDEYSKSILLPSRRRTAD